MSNELLPCPFCGRKVDDDLIDTLYPSGSYLRPGQGYVSYRDHQPGDIPCWSMHCPQHSGGCGAQIDGDTEKEVRAAWNRRPNTVEPVIVKSKEIERCHCGYPTPCNMTVPIGFCRRGLGDD